jgi:hypothetical protein
MQSQSSTKNTPPCRLRLTLWQTGEALVFFFAAESENKKLLGVLPHSYSESFVPFRDTDEGEN